MNSELSKELDGVKRDRLKYKAELDNEKKKMEYLLKNGMGKDIDNVINGKEIVKIPFFSRLKFKFNVFFNKLFNTI